MTPAIFHELGQLLCCGGEQTVCSTPRPAKLSAHLDDS